MISMPGVAGRRLWLANSISACDTAGMPSLSRRLARLDAARVVAGALAVAWIAMLSAYVFAASTTQFSAGAVAAAVSALAIAAGGFLYAWREPAPFDR